MKTFKSYEDVSREARWGRFYEDNEKPDTAALQLGYLGRIAEATETIARILSCRNFRAVPAELRKIAKNTTKPKRAKK